MVFGINSASNAVRKCEIVRGEAECYFTLPDCIASAINPNTTVWAILLQINPTFTMSLIGTVLIGTVHSMLLLLKNLTLFVAAISIGVAMVAGSGSSTGLKSELRMSKRLSSCTSALLSFKKQAIEGQKTQSLLLLQPYYRFYAQLKVAKVRPKQAQLVCAAHGTREPC